MMCSVRSSVQNIPVRNGETKVLHLRVLPTLVVHFPVLPLPRSRYAIRVETYRPEQTLINSFSNSLSTIDLVFVQVVKELNPK